MGARRRFAYRSEPVRLQARSPVAPIAQNRPGMALQNLHPRFKSGRRLQILSSNSIACVLAAQTDAKQMDANGLQNPLGHQAQPPKSLNPLGRPRDGSRKGGGPPDFHPENARDGMKPQREAFHYASFCSILLWDITRVRGSGRRSSHWLFGA